jgi:exo-poly-alpha-galacturonosidase
MPGFLALSRARSFCVLCLVAVAAKQCDITKYGAKSGSSDNTKAVQAAIKDCLTGGEVVVPAGVFKSFPITVEGVRNP